MGTASAQHMFMQLFGFDISLHARGYSIINIKIYVTFQCFLCCLLTPQPFISQVSITTEVISFKEMRLDTSVPQERTVGIVCICTAQYQSAASP